MRPDWGRVFVADFDLAAALCLAGMYPVGRPEAGALEAGRFEEALERHGRIAVTILPVASQVERH